MRNEDIESERRINSAQVRELCGGVSDMTLWRWERERDFPKAVYIGTRKFWRAVDVIAWLSSRPTTPPGKFNLPAKTETPAWAK